MRRAINTISTEEYDKLLREAMQRMRKKISRLADEEESKMRTADNKGDYEKAELYDFNSRALICMADMYYPVNNVGKEDKQ